MECEEEERRRQRELNKPFACAFFRFSEVDMRLTDEQIKAIEQILSKDQRVELIPIKDGVRVFEIRRKEIK